MPARKYKFSDIMMHSVSVSMNAKNRSDGWERQLPERFCLVVSLGKNKKPPRNRHKSSISEWWLIPVALVAYPAGGNHTSGGFFTLSYITSCRFFAV